jgi:hypothetical protein
MIARLRERWRAGVLRRRRWYIMARYAVEMQRALDDIVHPGIRESDDVVGLTAYERRRASIKLAEMLLTRIDFQLRAAEQDIKVEQRRI